jgi:Nitrile hydratase beta subunit, N-terminal
MVAQMSARSSWTEAEASVDVPFTDPWQCRAVALAVGAVDASGASWDDFRQRLIAAIAEEPDRPYFDSWLVALERFTVDVGAAAPEALQTQRMLAASYRTDESGHGDLEVFPIVATEETLLALLTDVFEHYWEHVRFGPLIEGAVYELRAPQRPELSMLDGYLTIGFDGWHVHLCIGEHRGTPANPVDPALARRRRCAHAELQRSWAAGAPNSWMVRLFNGDGDQQLTVLLPHPFLDDEQRIVVEPDWARLELWDHLRERFLGLPPDPVDRSADRFVHA